MDNIEENIKLLINKDKQSHAKNINLIDLFINYIPLSSPEQTTNPYNIQKLLKKDYEIENVDTSYFHYINENLKNININIVGRPFYRQTHDIINCNSQKETLSKYYQFIVSSGQECYQFLNNYPLFKRASLQKPLIQKREKIEYITALPVSENSKKDKNFLKYELNPSGKEFLLKTNKNIKISTMKLFYTLDNDALRMFELNENDITFNSFIVSIDVYIKYLSNIIITLYPVNLVKLTSNLNNYGQNEEKEEEDLEATLVNKKRSYSDINNGNNSSILKKVKIEENGIGIKEGGEIQTLEKLNLKQKPPLLRIIDNIFNVNYLSLNDLPFSKICNHGQLLFMRENEEKDQYLYIFSSDFALNIASQSSYFDLDIKNNYVHKNKYKFYFDYYSIRVFSNDSIDNSYDYYENYFLKKNDKTKVLQNTSIPVIYALSRNLSSSITLKIILFVLRMNLNYTKKGKYSSFSTSSANSFYTSDGKDIKEDLSFKFNEKTGLSFLNGKYSSEPYHYLWLKDDFISHPSTHFQHQDNKKYGNDNINNNEDEKDLFASSLHFSNENLDASMTSYDIIRFNDNNFNSPNNNELHLTIPINNNGRTSIKDYTREETTSKNKLYLFMKSTKKFIATSYQMDFVPIISINFFMKSLKQRIIQFINQQLYTSSSEFLTFSRKFNHLDHQNSLTYHDFICIPSIMFVLAVKLYYIHPSPKSFALIRLLLMIHIKKQTFLNPSIDNKDYNFFVQALDEFFKMIKEMWGSYYEDEILNNKNYIIHPQLYNRKPHKDLQNIFLNKTKKTLSFRSFINILFGDEIIKYYNEPSSHEIILGKDQDGTIQVTDKNERKYIEKSPDNYGIEDKKSIFKYFSTLYTNHCLANYLLKQCRLNPTASFTLGSPQNNKSKKKYGNNPPVYYQGIYLFLSRKIKKLYVEDINKKLDYFLIEDNFEILQVIEEDDDIELEKGIIDIYEKIDIKKENIGKKEKRNEPDPKVSLRKACSPLTKSLLIRIFRPYIIHLFDIHCQCMYCCQNQTLNKNHHSHSSHSNYHQHYICVNQVMKYLLSASSISSSSPYVLLEKYNKKIESLYVKNEFVSSPTTTPSNSHRYNHFFSLEKKWKKCVKERKINEFFSNPQFYDMNLKEEKAIHDSITFFRKYKAVVLQKLNEEAKSYLSSIQLSSSSTSSAPTTSTTASLIPSITSSSDKSVKETQEQRFICRIPSFLKRNINPQLKSNEINFKMMLNEFNRNRSEYCCTCYDYLYHGGHYLCRHIIAGQLNNIYEKQKSRGRKGNTSTSTISHSQSLLSSYPSSNAKMSLLEIKRSKYSTTNPFLKLLQLQLLNIIKH